jgi:hypothetical protein
MSFGLIGEAVRIAQTQHVLGGMSRETYNPKWVGLALVGCFYVAMPWPYSDYGAIA